MRGECNHSPVCEGSRSGSGGHSSTGSRRCCQRLQCTPAVTLRAAGCSEGRAAGVT